MTELPSEYRPRRLEDEDDATGPRFWPFFASDPHQREFDTLEILGMSSAYLGKGIAHCGIYFLIDCDVIVYVGQSVDVISRLEQHWNSNKVFNRFFFIPCKRAELNKLEAAYILRFRPKYNVAIPKEER